MALASVVAMQLMGLSVAILSAYAPDLASVVAVVAVVLCLPAAWRAWAWASGSRARRAGVGRP